MPKTNLNNETTNKQTILPDRGPNQSFSGLVKYVTETEGSF